MFELKADPEYPHHYMFGVSMHDMRSKHPGEMYLKYGPIYFTHEDIIKVQNAAILSVDKIYKTSSKEASEVFGCKDLVVSISGMRMAAMTNQVSIHHFSSKFEVSNYNEWFVNYVKLANSIQSIKEALLNAKIPRL